MAERILKSPGVTARELDLSAPTQARPQGVPAGVIGTSEKGPAFVPTVFATANDFVGLFGNTKGKHYGVMGMKEWMRNSQSGLYLRTLGVGNALKASGGKTEGAGFVIGEELIDYTNAGFESEANGVLTAGANPFAGATAESQLELNILTEGRVPTNGQGEEAQLIVSDGLGAVIDIGLYDGLYLSATHSDGAPDEAHATTKYIFWLSDQATTANGGDRLVDGLTIKDGEFIIADFTAEAPDSIVIIDMTQLPSEIITPGTGTAAELTTAIDTALTAASFTITVTGAAGITFNTGNGTIETWSLGTSNTNALAGNLTLTSLATGEVQYSAIPTVYTLELSNGANELHDGSTFVVTKSDTTVTTLELDTDSNFSDTQVDVAGQDQATAAAAAGTIAIQFTAAAGTAVGDNAAIVTITFDPAQVGESLPTIVMDENAPSAPAGTTYFLSAPMKGLTGSDYLPGARTDVVRAAIMFANGVVPGLETTAGPITSIPSASWGEYGTGKDAGLDVGKLDGDKFRMVLNGFTNTDYQAHLTGSFDPTSPVYLGKVLNTDPSKLQERGHYLYVAYDIPGGMAELDSTADGLDEVKLYRGAHSVDGEDKEVVDGTNPNFDNWRQKFTSAATPWIMSQKLGDTPKKLFRFHSLDAGTAGAGKYKVSVLNITKSTDTSSAYGRFDIQIRDAHDTDDKPVVLQTYSGLSLNPGSDRYIARVIGDQNTFFDFERADGKQKLVVEGLYLNQSPFVRVEVNEDVEDGTMEPTALPIGFRGKSRLNLVNTLKDSFEIARTLVEAPLPLRSNLSLGQGSKKTVDSRFFWGLHTQDVRNVNQRNKETGIISLVDSLTKHFPTMGTAVSSGDSNDADAYNNNGFSLERVWVKVQGTDPANPVDPTMWAEAEYIRDGNTSGNIIDASGTFHQDKDGSNKDAAAGYRYLDVAKDFGQSASKKYFKFSVPFEGGFDGLDIFDREKSEMSSLSSVREMAGEGPTGPTTAAFRKAIEILAEKSDVDIQVLATPGMRSEGITDFAVDKTEERFDALYIMDVESIDHDLNFVTKASQEVSVTNTAQNLVDRNLDTSFAAAYFPDVVMQDGQQAVVVPPSVVVLGALSLNDAIAHPWFAPAGFARGALPTTVETAVKLNRTNMDVLYESDINPITSFPQTGESVVIFGQKTLLQSQSALDRVNVRRLLIDIRRKVRAVASGILFEPNRESTLAKFSALVNPIMSRIQAQNGLSRYKVVIDTTTTTQQDVENNTIRGKIFLQPTKSIEFISLDFVVGNQGMEL